MPGDLSIVGFDDNPDAAYYSPALTTVRLDVAGEARRCVAEASMPRTPPRRRRHCSSSFVDDHEELTAQPWGKNHVWLARR